MRRLAVLLVLLCGLQGGCAVSGPSLQATYLANEGSPAGKIDVVFREPLEARSL